MQAACLAQFSGLSEVVSRKRLWGVFGWREQNARHEGRVGHSGFQCGIALSRNVATMISKCDRQACQLLRGAGTRMRSEEVRDTVDVPTAELPGAIGSTALLQEYRETPRQPLRRNVDEQ